MTTSLETKRLIMRRLRLEDAPSIYEYARDPEVAKFTMWDPHQSSEDSKWIINASLEGRAEILGIILKDAPSQVIGTVSITIRDNKTEGELAYALGQQYWRQGIMFEASAALIEKAFAQDNLERIFATCVSENIASSAVMKKLGMMYEGCLRSKFYRKNRFWDLEQYAILKDEWQQLPTVEGNYEIEYQARPNENDLATLGQGIIDNAKLQKDMPAIEPFGFFIKQFNQVLAGCNGVVLYGCLYVDQLWVKPTLRSQGFGQRLMAAAETLGRQKSCAMATVSTMDWEALSFYHKLGYNTEFVRHGFAKDSSLYMLRKNL